MVATICNPGLKVPVVAHSGRSSMSVAVRTQRCLGSAGTLPFFELVPAMAFQLPRLVRADYTVYALMRYVYPLFGQAATDLHRRPLLADQ